jgi:Ca2+-binding EF-hand superfamily protein
MGGGMMGGGQGGGMGGGMMGGGQGGAGHGGGQGGGMGGMMKKMMDADGDGQVTPDEARAALKARMQEFDKNGDGTLSIEEFENLNSKVMRERMVDRFQFLDNDGDGKISADEMIAPAKHMGRKQKNADAAQSDGMGMDMNADQAETKTDN